MLYKGGENKEDHGCRNMSCPARVEAVYYGNVKVRDNWYFAAGYTLPFKFGGSWYCVVGPIRLWFSGARLKTDFTEQTQLQEIHTFRKQMCISWNNGNPIFGDRLQCSQKDVWSIPYMALPVNSDFNREFDVLIGKFDRYLNKLVLLK